MEIILVPTILFLVVVAPIWLVMHYRYKREMAKGISRDELSEIEEMLEKIDRLADRLDVLEKILQEEKPNWRNEASRHK